MIVVGISKKNRDSDHDRSNKQVVKNYLLLNIAAIAVVLIVMQFNFFQYYTAEFLQAMKERVGEE